MNFFVVVGLFTVLLVFACGIAWILQNLSLKAKDKS